CAAAHRALSTFLSSQGVDTNSVQVTHIPLHGHGKVDMRIEQCLQVQLPAFKTQIQEADTVLVMAHSQGGEWACDLLWPCSQCSGPRSHPSLLFDLFACSPGVHMCRSPAGAPGLGGSRPSARELHILRRVTSRAIR